MFFLLFMKNVIFPSMKFYKKKKVLFKHSYIFLKNIKTPSLFFFKLLSILCKVFHEE